MKIRKTNQNERGVYKYTTTERTETGNYVEKTIVIKPGENGVTELDIKRLHSLDDSEVYYNLKNSRPERTTEEKNKIKEWNQNYIKNYKTEHGYEPNSEEIRYAQEIEFPRNYNISLDYDNNGEMEQDKRFIERMINSETKEEFDWSDRLKEAFKKLTERQKEVIHLLFVEDLKQNEVAKRLGISPAAVNKHLTKALIQLKKYL